MPRAGGQGATGPLSSGESDFVVVANRLPIDMERLPDGSTTWKRSPGGLVTALEPHAAPPSRRLDRLGRGSSTTTSTLRTNPSSRTDLRLHPVRLSADDVAEYYEGFSNATLWPLYHDVIVKPLYHREWWDRYVDGQSPVRQSRVTRRRAAVRPSGCRTISCSWCPRCCANCDPI